MQEHQTLQHKRRMITGYEVWTADLCKVDPKGMIWALAHIIKAHWYFVRRSGARISAQTTAVRSAERLLKLFCLWAVSSPERADRLADPLAAQRERLRATIEDHFYTYEAWSRSYPTSNAAYAGAAVLRSVVEVSYGLASGLSGYVEIAFRSLGDANFHRSAESCVPPKPLRSVSRLDEDWLDARLDAYSLLDFHAHPIQPRGACPSPLWDWVAERCPEPQRVGTLGDALTRAREWRLRWWVPHERAIAERLSELPAWCRA